MNGDEPIDDSVNAVRDVPENFKKWVTDNSERIERAEERGTLPYFIMDNRVCVSVKSNMSLKDYVSKNNIKIYDNMLYFLEDTGSKNIIFDPDKYNDSPMEGYNIVEFDTEIRQLLNERGIYLENVKLHINEISARFEYKGKFDGDEFILERSFRYDFTREGKRYKSVHHDLLVVPEKLQGNGMSKEIFQKLYKQYGNAGITYIDVQANIDVGGYTWARYGFSANKDNYSLLRSLANNQYERGIITEDNMSNFMEWISLYKGEDIPLYKISDKDYFKKMMKGSNWYGYIDLNNSEQRKAFEDYLFKSK
jgi:hypothetical protein